MSASSSSEQQGPKPDRQDFALHRADELSQLLDAIQALIVPFIRSADEDAAVLPTGHGLQFPGGAPRTALVEHHPPHKLSSLLSLSVPESGLGASDLSSVASSILQYSVNTSSPGFLDKLYSSPSPPGLAADLLLSALNTNSHVYSTSPALTLIEKHVGTELARLFGLRYPHAGGVTVPGGTAANTTALLVARNARFPRVKEYGVASLPGPLAVFVSEAAHYSIVTAAQTIGLGSKAVRKVATTSDGTMDPEALEAEMAGAVEEGRIPFFVVGTSGTTVRGAYDPLVKIGQLAHDHGAWFHVDACWGGGAVFSEKLRGRLQGSEMADSIAFNPHKMLGVPLTCSFLLGRDLRTFWVANRLEAGYLFHGDAEGTGAGAAPADDDAAVEAPRDETRERNDWREQCVKGAPRPDTVFDLASITPQCGRRSEALKLYLHWRFYGTAGIAAHVEAAFAGAARLSSLVACDPRFRLVGAEQQRPPCTQVCFYFVGAGHAPGEATDENRRNSSVTRAVVEALVPRGWMVDYAPGEAGEFLRVVCNRLTTAAVAEGLVKALVEVGEKVVRGHGG